MINKSHFGIYAILLKGDAILLIRKGRGPYIGKLDLPGGRPEREEMPLQTVQREVLEETGVIVHKAILFKNYATTFQQYVEEEKEQETVNHTGMLYLVTDYDDNGLTTEMDAEDSLGAQWYELSSLASDILSPFAIYAIRDIKRDIL